MNKTAQKHLDAIRAGSVDRSNVIGLRKLINASVRKARGYHVGATSCYVGFDDLDLIVSELDKCRPIVTGVLHESGLKLLQSPRYAKRLQWASARIHAFRLVRFDDVGQTLVPVYRCEDAAGNHLFTFRNISWQSGGNGPEIQGREF